MPGTITLADLVTPLTATAIASDALALLTAAGFPTTSWQSTSVPKGLVAFEAGVLADLSNTVAQVAAGGVLDLATGDWLALLCKDIFDESPRPAVITKGTITLTESAGSLRTFAAGALVVVDSATSLVFRNAALITLPASSAVTATIVAESPGVAYNVQAATLGLATPVPGVALTAAPGVTWITTSGADVESDDALRARCKLKWSQVVATTTGTTGNAINGSADAYTKVALDASAELNRILVTETALAVPPSPSVTITVASTTGAPTAGALAAAAAAIENKRPIGIIVSTVGAAAYVFTLTGTVKVKAAYHAAAQALISKNLNLYFAGTAQTLNGDTLAGLQIGGTIVLAELLEILMSAPGVTNAQIVDGAGTVLRPITDDILLTSTQVATLVNSLTYVDV